MAFGTTDFVKYCSKTRLFPSQLIHSSEFSALLQTIASVVVAKNSGAWRRRGGVGRLKKLDPFTSCQEQ